MAGRLGSEQRINKKTSSRMSKSVVRVRRRASTYGTENGGALVTSTYLVVT
jgi:hypothetical protein